MAMEDDGAGSDGFHGIETNKETSVVILMPDPDSSASYSFVLCRLGYHYPSFFRLSVLHHDFAHHRHRRHFRQTLQRTERHPGLCRQPLAGLAGALPHDGSGRAGTLPLLDSLDMQDADRERSWPSCQAAAEKAIVIIHGTDTMRETAAVLGPANLGQTIVLTGAMIPYEIANSDALFNLGFACGVAQTCRPACTWQ
jgi:hypothetical protein